MLQNLAKDSSTPAHVVAGVTGEVCQRTPDDDVTVLAARYDAAKATALNEQGHELSDARVA
jgi:hypothetical protein